MIRDLHRQHVYPVSPTATDGMEEMAHIPSAWMAGVCCGFSETLLFRIRRADRIVSV